MTISGSSEFCNVYNEVTYQQQRFSHRPRANVYRYVMAKLETTLPHSYPAKQHTFVPVMYSWTKILPLGYRSWIAYFLQVPRGLSDRIEIIDDKSQSAVVDSLLELVSRRRSV
jgi:hypothetical protein